MSPMARQKETSPRRISRRHFIAAGLGAAALYAATNPGLRRLGLNLPMPEISSGKPQSLEAILAATKKEYGIEVPIEPDEKYRVDLNLANYEGVLNNGLNTQLTLDEAKVLSQSLDKIPAAGEIYQLIIPYRFALYYPDHQGKLRERFAGGTNLGYFWPIGRGQRLNDSLPKIIAQEHPKSPFFATDKAAFELKLPDQPNLDDPLPAKKSGDVPLGSFTNIATSNVRLNLKEEVPWTTHRERLKQAIIHEFGHGLLNQVALSASCDQVHCDTREYYQGLSISLINGETVDWDHPIIKTFAQVNGWQLVTFTELLGRFGIDANSDIFKEAQAKEKQGKVHMYWARNPDVWGDLAHRKPRLTTYASYGPIQEAFAEFWMASIAHPQYLNKNEKDYFAKIHNGLKDNPKQFFDSIAKDSKILLSEGIF